LGLSPARACAPGLSDSECCFRVLMVRRILCFLALQLASAVSTDEARSCIQHLVLPLGTAPPLARQALLQIHHKVNTAIGPGFLSDQKPDTPASDTVQNREEALPGNGEPPAPSLPALPLLPPAATGRRNKLASLLAAVQARAVETADPGQHSLQLLDTPGQASAEEPVSVQLDHSVSDVGNMMGLFAAGVAAGTRAAINNAIPGDLLAKADSSTAPAGLIAGAEQGVTPGAMSFFNNVAKITDSRQDALRRQPRVASLLVLAATSGAGAKSEMRAVEHEDATGTLIDVLAPMRGVATEEEQRRTLDLAQRRDQQHASDEAQVQTLESQLASEEDMVKTMSSSWGF